MRGSVLGSFLGASDKPKPRAQTAVAPRDSARKGGWLYKRSRHLARWRRRYCVLADGKLFTYKTDDPGEEATESVALDNFRVEEDENLASHFRLFRKYDLEEKDDLGKNDPHHYHFYGDDLTDVIDWIQHFRALESVRLSNLVPYLNVVLSAITNRKRINTLVDDTLYSGAGGMSPVRPSIAEDSALSAAFGNAAEIIQNDHGLTATNKLLEKYIPIREEMPERQLFELLSDGVVFCLMMNVIESDCLDMRLVNIPENNPIREATPDIAEEKAVDVLDEDGTTRVISLSEIQICENLQLALSTAQTLGLAAVKFPLHKFRDPIVAYDITRHFLHHLMQAHLSHLLNLRTNAELNRLAKPGESEQSVEMISTPEWLIRWMNYLLGTNSTATQIAYTTPDMINGKIYARMMAAVFPDFAPHGYQALIDSMDVPALLESEVQSLRRYGCTYTLTAQHLAARDVSFHKLFMAVLFSLNSGLEPLSEDEQRQRWMGKPDRSVEISEIEENIQWIRSLIPNHYVHKLDRDTDDGIVLLKILDKLGDGCVDWTKIRNPTRHRYDKVNNCNEIIRIAKRPPFEMRLVNIGGVDIVDGNMSPLLSVLWQMRRYYMVKTLQDLKFDGRHITDETIRQWANEIVVSSNFLGLAQPISSWSDRKLSAGLFFLELVVAVDKDLVDPDHIVTDFAINMLYNVDEEAINERKKRNIRYAMTCCRKLGGIIFVSANDVLNCKPHATLTVAAAILTVGLKSNRFSSNAKFERAYKKSIAPQSMVDTFDEDE